MTMRTTLLSDKAFLFSLLSSNDLNAATEFYINSDNDDVRADAGFIALSTNKPEFIDIIFANLDVFNPKLPSELLKQVTFASCEEHYKALTNRLYPDVTNIHHGFIEDIFTSVVHKDDALFLNWLLDNGFEPQPNYYHEDPSLPYPLLDMAGHYRAYKCTSILIERGFETDDPQRLKDMAWLYPHSEEALNSAELWEMMLQDIPEDQDILRAAKWLDKMIKSGRNSHFALIAILNLYCKQECKFFHADNLNVLTKSSERISSYLNALSRRAFPSLSKSETLLALFFLERKATTEWDIDHVLTCLTKERSTEFQFNPCSNSHYLSALACQTDLYVKLKQLSSQKFTRLQVNCEMLLQSTQSEDDVSDSILMPLMMDNLNYLDSSPKYDNGEEHF